MHLRAQVSLFTVSALPKDTIVNTFHFNTDTGSTGNFDTIVSRLDTLYSALGSYISTIMNGQARVKIYDLEDQEPRTPVHDATFTYVPDGGPTMPADVAICLSYQAATVSGESPRRRRGRLYLGHPNDACRGPVNGADITVHTNARNAIAAQFDALASAVDPKWAVFSPTTAGPSLGLNGAYTEEQLAPAFNDVTNGWIDDRFDTQRRRGATPTTRTLWSV